MFSCPISTLVQLVVFAGEEKKEARSGAPSSVVHESAMFTLFPSSDSDGEGQDSPTATTSMNFAGTDMVLERRVQFWS